MDVKIEKSADTSDDQKIMVTLAGRNNVLARPRPQPTSQNFEKTKKRYETKGKPIQEMLAVGSVIGALI